MVRHLSFGLIKFLMVSAPFLSMVMMILALWGVVGKANYADLDVAKRAIADGDKEAKNYLVNETKNSEKCPEALKSPDVEPEGEDPMPGKIDWEHIV